MGTNEKLGVNIHVDQLMDAIASNCGNLERLELRYWAIVADTKPLFCRLLQLIFCFCRWDPENLRFSDKSQKAIDLLRVKCLKLRCMVLRYVCLQKRSATLVWFSFFPRKKVWKLELRKGGLVIEVEASFRKLIKLSNCELKNTNAHQS